MSHDFDHKLREYAELAVHTGLGLRSGQRLIVRASVECAPLVREIADVAYRAGCRLVDAIWNDDRITLSRFNHAPRDSFTEIAGSLTDPLIAGAERGDAILAIHASDPDLLKEQDPELVATSQRTVQRYMRPYSEKIMSNRIAWSVIAAPVPAWAAKVFPGAPAAEQVDRLWDAIFSACRVDGPDPAAAWSRHTAELVARRRYMNEKQYVALEYRGPGTELRLGLPRNHRWLGGESRTTDGHRFIANMPTEEIFSMPHRLEVDGVVRTTRPLGYAGTLIEEFELSFRGGRVVEISAPRNQAVLEKLMDTDEGARRLGEVALVPESSALARQGHLFYNTLFDENASCHLAVGRAYRGCVEDGADMTADAFAAAGGNDSLTHVDFMIGGPEMTIEGVSADGSREPVIRNGEWAFEVKL